MSQLIAHLIGDYVLQNHWMAANKTARTWPAVVHVLLYGLPFLVIGASWPAWAVIVGTHFVIDRFRLARLWARFWGVGTAGWLPEQVSHYRPDSSGPEPWFLENSYKPLSESLPAAPPWLAGWLVILVDNTAHLTINALAIWLLP